jgi:FkbM family methyltransferase
MPKLSKSLAVLRAAVEASYFGLRLSPISFWDIGARWGLSRSVECLYRLGFVRPVFFEPDPLEAARLLQTYSKVFNYALSNNNGEATLYVTREPGGSSLLKPINTQEIAKTVIVPTIRADMLNFEDQIRPEILKLDIQGSELAALEGFGSLLDHVVCIEAEVSFHRMYEAQPLSDDITRFLMGRGFGLFDLKVFGVRSTRAAHHANAFYIRQKLTTDRETAVERVFRSLNRITLPA